MYFTKQTANMYKIAEERCAKKNKKTKRQEENIAEKRRKEKEKNKMIGGRN